MEGGFIYKLLVVISIWFPNMKPQHTELILIGVILLVGCIIGVLVSRWRRRNRDKKLFFTLMVERKSGMSRADAIYYVADALETLENVFHRVEITKDEKRK